MVTVIQVHLFSFIKMAKTHDDTHCGRCGNALNKQGSIRCSCCELWIHPKCMNLNPDMSKMLIEYEKERIGEFMCDYDMFWFPFDSQSCGIKLYQKVDNVHLVPDGLTYGGPQHLEQYTVTGLRMCHTNIQVRQTLIA